MFLILISAIIVVILLTAIICNFLFAASGYRGPVSSHFDGTRFHNLGHQDVDITFGDGEHERGSIWKFMFARISKKWQYKHISKTSIPKEKVFGSHVEVTYINHSTVLIQTEGLNFLTDPVWMYRASPFSFVGPHRFSDPGVKIADLPKIDIILQSHNHYDHMDLNALSFLSARDKPQILTPLGNSHYLRARKISGAHDLDWGDKVSVGEATGSDENIFVRCVPAQHFSARAFTDRNKTLWAGFVIETPARKIYFAGDTGFGPYLRTIKEWYPEGFDLAFIPIGAYLPRSFMHMVHIDPKEAIKIYHDLKVKNAIAIHHSTFDLGLDGQKQPHETITSLLSLTENKDVNFEVLENGQNKGFF